MNKIRTGVAASGALLLALAFSSPVAASAIISQSGQTGDWGTRSSAEGPEAKCGYPAAGSAGDQTLNWIKVFPVLAGPATGNSQKVSWTVVIQKSTDGNHWSTLKTAATQTGTATNAASVKYKTVTLNFTGKLGIQYRAVSTLKWLHNGSTSGTVKFRMTTYGIKVGNLNGPIFDDYCDGVLET